MKVKQGLIARVLGRFQSTKKIKAGASLPVYSVHREKGARQITNSEEMKRSRVYANVPLGMD